MLLEVFGTEEALDRMASVHPIGRIGRPEEIAEFLVEGQEFSRTTGIQREGSADGSPGLN